MPGDSGSQLQLQGDGFKLAGKPSLSLQSDNPVDVAQGTSPGPDDERCAPGQHPRVAQQRARNGDPLALSAAQLHATRADFHFPARRQFTDEIRRVGCFNGRSFCNAGDAFWP
jgi:hypothetical protein